MSGEQKTDAVLGEISTIAEALGSIPSPASVPLELGGTLIALVGPEVVHGFALLFHRLFHSKAPQAAGIKVVAVAQQQLDYLDTIDPDGQGKDV